MKNWDRVNRRGIILMYHRIARLDFDPRQLSVSPEHFQEQLEVIKKCGHPVRMNEMGRHLKRFSFGAKEIVVTLDDGYTDNFQNAKPILENLGVPATFFIISGAIGSQEEFFWDGLERTVLAPQTLPEVFEIMIEGERYNWQIKTEGPCIFLDYTQAREEIPQNGVALTRSQFYTALCQILSSLATDQRKNAMEHIAQWAGQTLTIRPDALPMDLDALSYLARCPIFEIGAHSVNHPSSVRLPLEKQKEEIAGSKQYLEKKLNQEITSFSYPHGAYSEGTVRIVKSLKFRNACTVFPGPVMRNSNPYQLPRFPVIDWGGKEFEQRLKEWLAL